MKNILYTIILSFLFSSSVFADLETAMTAYTEGNYEQAFKELKPLAEQNVTSAQFMLGRLYQNGKGIPQDFEKAVYWYKRAANAVYFANDGTLTLQKNATGDEFTILGIRIAQYNLGLMYKNGEGVQQNDQEAVKWYRLAAKLGDADAQNNLGNMYAEGRGIEKNSVRAYMWYFIASMNGNADGKSNAYILLMEDSEKTMEQKSNETGEARELADKCFDSNYKDCD